MEITESQNPRCPYTAQRTLDAPRPLRSLEVGSSPQARRSPDWRLNLPVPTRLARSPARPGDTEGRGLQSNPCSRPLPTASCPGEFENAAPERAFLIILFQGHNQARRKSAVSSRFVRNRVALEKEDGKGGGSTLQSQVPSGVASVSEAVRCKCRLDSPGAACTGVSARARKDVETAARGGPRPSLRPSPPRVTVPLPPPSLRSSPYSSSPARSGWGAGDRRAGGALRRPGSSAGPGRVGAAAQRCEARRGGHRGEQARGEPGAGGSSGVAV